MNAIVIYHSKYGSAKRYAEWLAEELSADLSPLKGFIPARLAEYDTVIFGGGIYAGGINGLSFVKKHYPANREKRWFVFATGLAPVRETTLPALREHNFQGELQSIPCFALRGGMDYSSLRWNDKLLMRMMQQMLLKKPESERTQDDRDLLSNFYQKMDWCDRASLFPILTAIRTY